MRLFKFFPLVFLLLYVFFAFWPFFLQGKLPIPADTIVGLYHPWRDFFAQDYPNGLPFKNFLITDPVRQQYVWRELGTKWNPYTLLGAPLLANVQAAHFYPLNIMYRLLPFPLAWSWQVVSQSLLGGIFMVLYLRHLRLSSYAQTLGTLAWVGSGFFVAWQEWNTLVQVAIWLPMLLLSLDKNWRLMFVFSLASSFFAGHIQVFLYVLLVVLVYAVVKKKINLPFGFALLATAIITSVQWLPMLVMLGQSVRSIGPSDWQNPGWFLPWQHLAQFLAPDYFGNPATGNYFGVWNYGELVGYVGILPLFFASFAVKKRYLFWISAVAVSLLLALPTPVAKLVPPLFQPTRLLVIIDFSLSILAAYGLDLALTSPQKIFKRTLIFLGIFSLLGLVAWQNHWLISLRNLILPGAVFFLILVLWRIPRTGIILILLLTLFDLTRFFGKFVSFSSPTFLFPQTKVVDFLQEKSKSEIFRIVALDDRIFPPNFATYYRLQAFSGYDSHYLKTYADLFGGVSRILTPKDIDDFDRFNVKYLLTFGSLPDPKYQLVLIEGQTRVYENQGVLPRVSLAGGKAEIVSYAPDKVIIRTKSKTAGELVLRDAYYPAWEVRIDGQRASIDRVDHVFRGVTVPSGEHEVVFTI